MLTLTRKTDVAALGTILGVWAHPDDEAYLSGGLMTLARDAGSRVVCVTATRGEHGTGDPRRWPPGRLAVRRTAELRDCLDILGVGEHHWLGYQDGRCAAVPPSGAIARLGDLIDEIRPDTVVTFGPDGNTGHPDHRTVARWTAAAVDWAAPAGTRLLQTAVTPEWANRWRAVNERFDVFLPGFPVTRPEPSLALRLTLDEDTLARKVRALAAQATQTEALIAAMGVDDYAGWVAEEAFTEAVPDSGAHPACGRCWWDVTAARWRCAGRRKPFAGYAA
ncbi:PIG-L family deacetylase [Actinoplanes sp. NEAU-A12]|uniref:PIG-L family deacetylase n=1 Tax=Actinoplanes sandaracinus TaxID=3045177 RepID=A0ABT6WXF6_9ACTN|nr:PIG-L family deacetylase [Actinoplanes sandaracinus]MDI6104423.1 PIG-L family deacetylase [Actinoplanes sandaracinus]